MFNSNMAAKRLPWYLLLFLLVLIRSRFSSAKEEFHEELLVKPFPTGEVLTYFQFTTLWDVQIYDNDAFSHYSLFPKSFGQIITKYAVEELHFSLTQGLWRTHKWGYPLEAASPGAELAVWFQDKVLESVDKQWRELTNALSGQFCASLNFIKAENTASPKISFRRRGVTSSPYNDSRTLRYASLPHEIVCTENLTPWKKLLPCDSKSGVSSLLNSLLIYKVKYHSMSIHLRTICKDSLCKFPLLELKQTISIVTDPVLRTGSYDWSIRKLFGRPLRSACPLATTSQVYVDISGNNTHFAFSLKPRPKQTIVKQLGNTSREFAVYNLKAEGKIKSLLSSNAGFNLVLKWKQRPNKVQPPYFFAHRFLTGYGQEHAGIECVMYNHHPTQSIHLVYFQIFPWHFRTFLHTLRVHTNDINVKPDYVDYLPSKDREQPTCLEIKITLPPKSSTSVHMKLERVFLKWTEHPPDAHHGFYLASGVITAKLEFSENFTFPRSRSSLLADSFHEWNDNDNIIRVYTEVLLVTLPTPDFSMPYNVICLTCTVVAIGFGSLYNLSTRRLQEVDPREPTGILGKVKNRLLKLKNNIFSKVSKPKCSESKKKE